VVFSLDMKAPEKFCTISIDNYSAAAIVPGFGTDLSNGENWRWNVIRLDHELLTLRMESFDTTVK